MNNYRIIYEASTECYIPIGASIFLFIEIAWITISVVKWKKEVLSTKLLLLFLMMFFCFLLLCNLYEYVDVRLNITEKYKFGIVEVVEGEIYDYESVNKNERGMDHFFVDGVEFSLSSFTGYGYNIKQRDGGILKNGIYVRIYYIPYKYENVMMKLELLDL